MTEKECWAILEINEEANAALIKRAYRRLAFSLHPDLNPSLMDGGRRFQLLNEAYVTLMQLHEERAKNKKEGEAAHERVKKEASKAYAKAKAEESSAQNKKRTAPGTEEEKKENFAAEKEKVISDILSDPFARRVFDDIYNRVQENKNISRIKAETISPQKLKHGDKANGTTMGSLVVGKVKGWLRKQIDDEHVLKLPGAQIIPGARVRMEIQHGISGEPQTVEVTLPPEFGPGKVMRLKGMGKKLGSLSGDLYVRIESI